MRLTLCEYPEYFKILPSIHDWSRDPDRIGNGVKVGQDFKYCSDTNTEWMDIKTLQEWIKKNQERIGKI